MASTDSKIADFLTANRKFAETYPAPPTMQSMRAMAAEAGGALLIRMLISSPVL